MLAIISMAFATSWSVIYTLLIKQFPIKNLPYAFIGINIFTLITGNIYLFLVDRIKRDRLLFYFIFFPLLGILLARIFMPSLMAMYGGPVIFFTLISIATSCCFKVIPLQIWAIVNDFFTPLHAKKLNNIFIISWITGGIISGVIFHFSLHLIGVNNIVYLWCAELFLLLILSLSLRNNYSPIKHESSQIHSNNIFFTFGEVLKDVKKFKFFLILGSIVAFTGVAHNLVEFQFTYLVRINLPNELAVGEFLGIIVILRSIINLFAQLLIGNYFIRRFGILYTIMILPAIVLVGFTALFFHFELLEGTIFRLIWDYGLWTLIVSPMQIIYNVVPVDIRARIRGFCESVVYSSASILISLLIIVILQIGDLFPQIPNLDINMLNTMGIILAIGGFAILLYGKKIYIETTLNNLHTENGRTLYDSIELLDDRIFKNSYDYLCKVLDDHEGTAHFDAIAKAKALAILYKNFPIQIFDRLIGYLRSDHIFLRLCSIIMFKKLKHEKQISNTIVDEKIKNMFHNDPVYTVRYKAGEYLFGNPQAQEHDPLLERATDLLNDELIGKIEFTSPLFKHLFIQSFTDKNLRIRTEAITLLWNNPHYRNQIGLLIDNLAKDNNLNDNMFVHEIRMLISLRILNQNYKKNMVNRLKSSNPKVRAMACLYLLNITDMNSDVGKRLLNTLFDEIVESSFNRDDMIEIFYLITMFNDEVMDAIFEKLIKLPEEKKAVMNRKIQVIASIMEANFIHLEENIHINHDDFSSTLDKDFMVF